MPTNIPDNSIPGWKAVPISADSSNLPAPLAEFALAVRREDWTAAAHHLLEEKLQRVLPHDRHCPSWMEQLIGGPLFRKLVETLTHYPCFYCRVGRVACESCEGKGESSVDAICEDCCGFGISRCGFCGGSGWLALGAFPAGLREIVYRARTRRGLVRAAELIRESTHRNMPCSEELRMKLRLFVQELLHINRLLAMLENSVEDFEEGNPDAGGLLLNSKTCQLLAQAARGLVRRQQELVISVTSRFYSPSARQELSAREHIRWQKRVNFLVDRLETHGKSPSFLFSFPKLESVLNGRLEKEKSKDPQQT